MTHQNKKMSEAEIRNRMKVVCICKGIRAAKITDAIKIKGCSSVAEVNKCTGSGNGGCGATRCRPVIESMIATGGDYPTALPDTPPPEED